MKKQKGITLIALIITIIVMLILVTVTVTTAINGGLFESIRKASRDTQKQSVLEELNALTAEFNADLYVNPDKYYNEDGEDFEKIIMEQTKIRILGENNENPNSSVEEDVEYGIDGYAISFVYKGTNAKWKFVINPEEGTIDYIELILNGITIQEIGETPTINAVGNIKEVKEGVPIPKGFYYVTGTKNTGVVISDSEADKDNENGNNGNQFVWVPVKLNPKLKIVIDDTKNISKVTIMDLQGDKKQIDVNGKYLEEIIDFNESTIYEVAIEYEDGTKTENLYSTDLQYNRLSKNLATLKIAAEYYGGLENLADAYKENSYPDQNFEFKIDIFKEVFKDQEIYDTKDETPEKESVLKYGGFYIGRYEIGTEGTTKKDNSPKRNISFTAAKEEAEKAYNNEYKYGVKSSLPSGSAWNSTAKWIVNSKAESWDSVFNDSTSWGNYKPGEIGQGTLKSTGSSDSYSKNHIYDLAGNLQEWTLETANTNEKICRGSNYDVSGSPCMVSGYSTAVTATENDTGYRLMLYIIKE